MDRPGLGSIPIAKGEARVYPRESEQVPEHFGNLFGHGAGGLSLRGSSRDRLQARVGRRPISFIRLKVKHLLRYCPPYSSL
jgi:hypothetical protein